jgi:hypothetical protein
MQSPNAIPLSQKSRALHTATRHWLLLVPGVLLLATHILPVPQNGALGGLPAICPLKTLSGWPCPGCGLTRSLVLCAHGDWAQAFVFHPLGIAFYFGLWGALALGVLPLTRIRRALSQRALIFLCGAYAVTMVVFWLVRLAGILPYPSHF